MDILTQEGFTELINVVVQAGYGNEIDWQRNLKPCEESWKFANETIWVILNSGMKEQIARQIYNKVASAIDTGQDISEVFNHKGKVAAIKYVVDNYTELFHNYGLAEDRIAFLQTIPFIGTITCYHLAKNLGHDCVKPDRHLVRVAEQYKMSPDELCNKISEFSGEKKSTVDIIIWRACNLKFL